MISRNSIIGFRRNFSIIRNQFWTPVDRRFSGILNDLSKHKALFERALALVHAGEMYNYYDIVDREVKRNAEWRELEADEKRQRDKESMGKLLSGLSRIREAHDL
jgi:VIT1/CCC1 family predicted Fe2+/Mn2+ transporter